MLPAFGTSDLNLRMQAGGPNSGRVRWQYDVVAVGAGAVFQELLKEPPNALSAAKSTLGCCWGCGGFNGVSTAPGTAHIAATCT